MPGFASWNESGSASFTETMPKTDTIALDLHCAECGRSPQRGEVWSIYYAVSLGPNRPGEIRAGPVRRTRRQGRRVLALKTTLYPGGTPKKNIGGKR